MPKLSLNLPGFMRFGRSKAPADSSNAIGVSPSSCSSSPIAQGSSVPAAQIISDNSAGQTMLCSPPVGALNIAQSRNVFVEGDMNHVHYSYANTVINSSNKFMAELLEKTIPGAAFDSSAHDPPPRCHPGTRLAILARCLEFIVNAAGKEEVRWVIGATGVGKSAIMQNVTESPLPSMSKLLSQQLTGSSGELVELTGKV